MKRLALILGLSFALAASGFAAAGATAAEPLTLVLHLYGPGERVGPLDRLAAQLGLPLGEEIGGAALADYECHRVELVELATGKSLGESFDCFANITPLEGGAMTLLDVAIFNMPGGVVVSGGPVSLQPFVAGFGDGGEPTRTHMSGAVPSADNILLATGKFADMRGTVRVSGTMTLAETFFFDCIFVLRLTGA